MKGIRLLFFCMLATVSLCAQQDNPFSLERNDDVELRGDSVVVQAAPENNTGEATKIEGDNPFDVTHIPIRKNQIEQIEKLSFLEEEKSKDSIEIGYMPLWIVLISFCAIAVMIYIRKDHFFILLRSLMNENFMRLTQYEQSKSGNPIYLVGYLVFLVNLALFVHLVLHHVFSISRDWQFLMVFLALFVFFAGKHLVHAVFARIFNVEKERLLYDFTIVSFYNTLSVVFLILNILIVFGADGWHKALATAGVLVFILALLARYYKGFHIGRYYVNNYFLHFFMYFCAFEFSPWVLAYTVVKDFFLNN